VGFSLWYHLSNTNADNKTINSSELYFAVILVNNNSLISGFDNHDIRKVNLEFNIILLLLDWILIISLIYKYISNIISSPIVSLTPILICSRFGFCFNIDPNDIFLQDPGLPALPALPLACAKIRSSSESKPTITWSPLGESVELYW